MAALYNPAMMAAGIFITGTDTGVGKTYIGTQLCRTLHHHGFRIQPRKPVESGCDIDHNGRLQPLDASQYFSACGQSVALKQICPYRYQPAVAPDYAARLAGEELRLEELVSACQVNSDEFLLVEGAGGFYSPISSDGLNADLAEELGLPVLLVAANRLGAINHTLLTAEAIQRSGLQLVAVILNDIEGKNPNDDLNNAQSLKARLNCPVIEIPPDSTEEGKWLMRIEELLNVSATEPAPVS